MGRLVNRLKPFEAANMQGFFAVYVPIHCTQTDAALQRYTPKELETSWFYVVLEPAYPVGSSPSLLVFHRKPDDSHRGGAWNL